MDIESRKICMVGDFAVGKTSSVSRYVNNIFSEAYQTTIGVKVDTKLVSVAADKSLKLVIWDIAGRNKFGNVEFTYLRGSSGYILIADGTRVSTLTTALSLSKSVEARYGKIPFVLLINKSDLKDEWEIKPEDIENLEADGIKVFLTSAKNGEDIENAFTYLAQMIKT